MAQHTEAWQVFDANGEAKKDVGIAPVESRKTSEVIVGAVHAWIWRYTPGRTIEILLQHRAVDKPTWPDYLDISVAGHVDQGESLLEALQREADEEVGVQFEFDRVNYIFSYRNFENGFKWIYLYQQNQEVDYQFNDGEVQALKWVSLEDFEQMTASPEQHNLVPHPSEYFKLLLKALHQLT